MNVFNKVTLESLKKNRTRTIVTIIGIMLSAAMICASTTLVSSMQNFVLRCAIHIDGDWYGAVYDAAYKDYEDIRDSDRVSSAAYAQVLGYAKIDSANERKPYLYVLGGDAASGYFETMPVHLLLGTLPKDSTEIILPEHLTSNGKVNYKLGDTVTLDVGDRTLDGRRLGQDTPVYTYDSETQVEIMSGERLENTEPRTYTVVGIYERPTFEDYSAPGYTALTAADTKSADQAPIHCYFKLHKPAGVYDFMKEMGYTQEYRYAYNTKVLLYSGTAPFDSFLTAFYSLAAIIIALIVFGSVSLIYNAFSISVSERTRQFGLLSSVGATRSTHTSTSGSCTSGPISSTVIRSRSTCPSRHTRAARMQAGNGSWAGTADAAALSERRVGDGCSEDVGGCPAGVSGDGGSLGVTSGFMALSSLSRPGGQGVTPLRSRVAPHRGTRPPETGSASVVRSEYGGDHDLPSQARRARRRRHARR